MKKLKIVAGIMIVIFVPISFKILWFSYYTPRWHAIFYTFTNNGINPSFRGPFMTKEQCRKAGNDLIDEKKILIAGELEPATYFCGKDCDSEAFDRDGAVFDLSCSEGNPPERFE